jgi:hypothetical protein
MLWYRKIRRFRFSRGEGRRESCPQGGSRRGTREIETIVNEKRTLAKSHPRQLTAMGRPSHGTRGLKIGTSDFSFMEH